MKTDSDPKRVTSLAVALRDAYGTPNLGNHPDPLDELGYIILSAKTDESKYKAAFRRLRAVHPTWESVLASDTKHLGKLISPAGMGPRKAVLLQRCLGAIVSRFGRLDLSPLREMSTQQAEAALLALPGVGPKSARCVLLYSFRRPVLPVDVHTYRLAVRLGILSHRVSYQQSHTVLQEAIPQKLRRTFHVTAVAHGRKRCHARRPNCARCPVSNYCIWPKAERPVPVRIRPKPIAIDLFSGAGGMSLGFAGAGFEVVQAVERDKKAASSYRRNHPEVDVLTEDLRHLNPHECLRRLGLRPGDLTIVMGGPPCQGFSESNRRTRTLDNPKNHLYQHLLRFVCAMKPAWVVLENVAGLRTVARGEMLRRIQNSLRDLGYKAEWRELNAAEYGVPQVRRRLFVIANRIGIEIPSIPPTHGDGREAFPTVREAIGDLPQLDNGARAGELSYRQEVTLSPYARSMRTEKRQLAVTGNIVSHNAAYVVDRYSHIPPGGNWKDIPEELLANYEDHTRCHTGVYHRLPWERPAKVIGNFRKNMLIHPEQNRGLSIREAARLQSFPDRYSFEGSIGFQQQQVADAVPPLLAEAVAKAIISANRNYPESFTFDDGPHSASTPHPDGSPSHTTDDPNPHPTQYI